MLQHYGLFFFPVRDNDGCEQRWFLHAQIGENSLRCELKRRRAVRSGFTGRLASVSSMFHTFAHFPGESKLKLRQGISVFVIDRHDADQQHKLRCVCFFCTLNQSKYYVYKWTINGLQSLNLSPFLAVNTFLPMLHEVVGPCLSMRGERGRSKGERAPEKVLCAGLEGPEAFACQRLWF